MIPERPGLPDVRLVNRIVQNVRRLARLVLGPGLDQTWTTSGRSLSLSSPEPSFHARLTGGTGTASSPFRFRRVRLMPDGTWKELTSVDEKSVAFEANLQAVATNRIVLLRDVGVAGEYRFFLPRSPGTGCALITITASVTGCNCPIPGATAQLLKNGVAVGSGVLTGADGKAIWSSINFPSLTVGATGFSIKVSAPFYQDQTVSRNALVCGDNPSTITLVPRTGYTCTSCCPGVPGPINTFVDGGSRGRYANGLTISYAFHDPCYDSAASPFGGGINAGTIDIQLECDRVRVNFTSCLKWGYDPGNNEYPTVQHYQ
jgi:hypothetical protein